MQNVSHSTSSDSFPVENLSRRDSTQKDVQDNLFSSLPSEITEHIFRFLEPNDGSIILQKYLAKTSKDQNSQLWNQGYRVKLLTDLVNGSQANPVEEQALSPKQSEQKIAPLHDEGDQSIKLVSRQFHEISKSLYLDLSSEQLIRRVEAFCDTYATNRELSADEKNFIRFCNTTSRLNKKFWKQVLIQTCNARKAIQFLQTCVNWLEVKSQKKDWDVNQLFYDKIKFISGSRCNLGRKINRIVDKLFISNLLENSTSHESDLIEFLLSLEKLQFRVNQNKLFIWACKNPEITVVTELFLRLKNYSHQEKIELIIKSFQALNDYRQRLINSRNYNTRSTPARYSYATFNANSYSFDPCLIEFKRILSSMSLLASLVIFVQKKFSSMSAN